MKTSLKTYVTAALLATASLAYAQTQDPATTPRDSTTTPAATSPSSTPAATAPSSTPAATAPSTGGDVSRDERTQDATATESGDDMSDEDTSLEPRSDRN